MDIKALAIAAGFDVHPRKGEIRSAGDVCAHNLTATVEKFARLVAETEREACAKVCEERVGKWGDHLPDRLNRHLDAESNACANDIRARSNEQN